MLNQEKHALSAELGTSSMLAEADAGGEIPGEVSVPGDNAPLDARTISALRLYESQKAAKSKWQKDNKEYVNAYFKEWRAKNKDRVKAYRKKHSKDNKKGLPFGGLLGLLARQGGRCNGCGADLSKQRHLDHIIPKSRGGISGASNYQFLCPTCNMAKGAQTQEEFLEHCRLVLLHNGKWWE